VGWVLKHRADFGQNFEWIRKNRMHSTWVQNHLPKKSCTHSQTFPDFLGRNRNFLGQNRNFVGDNVKNVPWNRTNDGSFFMKQAVGLYEQAQISRKRAKYLKRVPKIPVFKLSENRIIPSNFFWIRIWALNGEVEIVKISMLQCQRVRNIYCCFLPKSIISSWTEIIWLLSSLFSFVSSIADNVENKRATRCLQENNDDRK